MSWRGTAVLTLLLVIVGAYVWFEEAPPQGPGTPPTLLGEPRSSAPATAASRLLDFNPDDVVAIHLEQDRQTRETARAGDTWQGVARPAAINDFLHNLVGLGKLLDIPADAAELKDYGLQTPHSVVQLHLRGRAEPLIIQIGDRNPATTGVYVRLGSNGPVVLAGALMAWEFDKAFRALGE